MSNSVFVNDLLSLPVPPKLGSEENKYSESRQSLPSLAKKRNENPSPFGNSRKTLPPDIQIFRPTPRNGLSIIYRRDVKEVTLTGKKLLKADSTESKKDSPESAKERELGSPHMLFR